MIRKSITICVLSLVGACTHDPPRPQAETRAPAASAAAKVDELARLDSRTPVPLLPMMANHQKQNMREHLEAIQQVVAALATNDLTAVGQAAQRLGFTPEMGQMCEHMGAGAPGFAEQAIAFHKTADRIVDAAREGDRDKVLEELSATLKTCTACHAKWKQQVVDAATWQRLASSAPPPGAP